MVHGGQLVSSRVQETDMGSRGVAMVESNGAQGFFMGQAGMDFKSLDDLAVVEAVAINCDRNGLHGSGHVFGVANRVIGAVH